MIGWDRMNLMLDVESAEYKLGQAFARAPLVGLVSLNLTYSSHPATPLTASK